MELGWTLMAIACASRHRRSLRAGTRRSLDRIGADGKGPQVEIAGRPHRPSTGVLALGCHWTRPRWADPRPVTNSGGITADRSAFTLRPRCSSILEECPATSASFLIG